MEQKNEISVSNQFAPDINIQAREDFLKRMNEAPTFTAKQADYAKIPDKGDYDTIPIGVLENMLDEVYLGLWETSKLQSQVVANEIVGSIELRVYDPSARVWLTRLGLGAVTIRQKKDSALTDIGSKIKTALQMDYPKLHSMCLKNAAKSLGKKFGRDLNRKFEDTYEEVYTNEIELSNVIVELRGKLDNCKVPADLMPVWNTYPQLHSSSEAKKIFNQYKIKLNLNGTVNPANAA